MSVILDPGEIRNFKPDNIIYDIAESLAQSPSVHKVLDPVFLDEKMTESGIKLSYKGEEERLKALFALIGLSNLSIAPIMSDNLGRSEYHIAGEVCRIVKALRTLAFLDKIPELQYLYNINRESKSQNNFWLPYGVSLPCPTIDERKAEDSVIIAPRLDGVIAYIPTLSTQNEWVASLTKGILPLMSKGPDKILKQLQTPFVLNTGGVVTVESPIFYRLADGDGVSEEVLPRELVGV